jgi:motility quorum-sensing regulator/GCU-specific mRNA interferase toxin
VTVKRKPHHPLDAVKAKFATVSTLEMTRTALQSAQAIGFRREDVVAVVQALEREDFVKSATAHSPPSPRRWHDTYVTPFGAWYLYLKFAGETLVDVTLVSFKEA